MDDKKQDIRKSIRLNEKQAKKWNPEKVRNFLDQTTTINQVNLQMNQEILTHLQNIESKLQHVITNQAEIKKNLGNMDDKIEEVEGYTVILEDEIKKKTAYIIDNTRDLIDGVELRWEEKLEDVIERNIEDNIDPIFNEINEDIKDLRKEVNTKESKEDVFQLEEKVNGYLDETWDEISKLQDNSFDNKFPKIWSGYLSQSAKRIDDKIDSIKDDFEKKIDEIEVQCDNSHEIHDLKTKIDYSIERMNDRIDENTHKMEMRLCEIEANGGEK